MIYPFPLNRNIYNHPRNFCNLSEKDIFNIKLLEMLGVPCGNYSVSNQDLVDILTDKNKLQKLLHRLSLKAFW